nr:RNA polymerase sigma factor [uncultured Sphingomonas sp.]
MNGLSATYQLRKADLRRFLVARTGSEADADDLMSDLWIKISAANTGPIDNPASYLFRMANNLVLDRLREARRRVRRENEWSDDQHGRPRANVEIADPAPNAEQRMIMSHETARLRDAVAQLPEGAQRVLRMHKFEELSHGEIAARLGISKSAVEKHMAVAMTHLRRLFKD